MARFRRKVGLVQAVQLLWTTWSEVCELLRGSDENKLAGFVGCFIDKNGSETDDSNGRIGLKCSDPPHPELAVVAREGDWVVKDEIGRLLFCSPAVFAAQFQPFDAYKVAFEPDWSKYPKLAAAFVHRPRENVYWEELRELLADARADAVQYVHDVRAEELAAARADERKRMKELP